METLASSLRLAKNTQNQVHDGFLFKGNLLCVPKCGTRDLVLKGIHGGSLVGHFGEDKAYLMAKEHYYWPHMIKDIQDIIKRCFTCQMAKGVRVIHLLKGCILPCQPLKVHG